MDKFILNDDSFYGIIDHVNASIYWKDLKGIYLGCNKYMLDMLDIKDRKVIIGKTDYELPWGDAATALEEHDKLAMEYGVYSIEESYVNPKGGNRFYLTKKSKLTNKQGKLIGVMGTSVDITAQKEAEQLRAQLEKHEVLENKNKLFTNFTQKLVVLINNFQILNDRGESEFNISDADAKIELTKREREVLYFLSRGKKPKEIAAKLGISHKTVQNIIDGKLFPKLGTPNIGDLLEKARILNLIPLTL